MGKVLLKGDLSQRNQKEGTAKGFATHDKGVRRFKSWGIILGFWDFLGFFSDCFFFLYRILGLFWGFCDFLFDFGTF